MPFPRKYHCECIIEQGQDIIFEIVKDVTRYHEFVPFCLRSRLLPGTEDKAGLVGDELRVFYAELAVGFNQFNESYVSKVSCYGRDKIEAEAVDSSLFNHLKSTWLISTLEDGRCKVDFNVDFEFKSYIYAYAANIFFIRVSKEMFLAFIKRAKTVSETVTKEENPKAQIT